MYPNFEEFRAKMPLVEAHLYAHIFFYAYLPFPALERMRQEHTLKLLRKILTWHLPLFLLLESTDTK